MNRSTTSSENELVLFVEIKAIEGKANELHKRKGYIHNFTFHETCGVI